MLDKYALLLLLKDYILLILLHKDKYITTVPFLQDYSCTEHGNYNTGV